MNDLDRIIKQFLFDLRMDKFKFNNTAVRNIDISNIEKKYVLVNSYVFIAEFSAIHKELTIDRKADTFIKIFDTIINKNNEAENNLIYSKKRLEINSPEYWEYLNRSLIFPEHGDCLIIFLDINKRNKNKINMRVHSGIFTKVILNNVNLNIVPKYIIDYINRTDENE